MSDATLAFGREILDVGDDFYRYRVRPGQFVGRNGSRGLTPDVCIVECERLGGGRPWRVAIKADCVAAVGQALLRYAEDLGGQAHQGGEAARLDQPG